MNTNNPRFIKATGLLKEYVEKNNDFESHFTELYNMMQKYIEETGHVGKVSINELLLGYTLVDYFEDVRRLMDFHHLEFEGINGIKIISYTSFWLLRRKVIQINDLDKDIIFINEKFVLAYILDFLSNKDKHHVLDRSSDGLTSFSKSLFYFLKYRARDAQSIEMFIMAFFAGQIYQETNEDISSKLPDYTSWI